MLTLSTLRILTLFKRKTLGQIHSLTRTHGTALYIFICIHMLIKSKGKENERIGNTLVEEKTKKQKNKKINK